MSPIPQFSPSPNQPNQGATLSNNLSAVFSSLGVAPISDKEKAELAELAAEQEAKPKSTPEQLQKIGEMLGSVFGDAPTEPPAPAPSPVAKAKPVEISPPVAKKEAPVAVAPEVKAPEEEIFKFSREDQLEVASELIKANSTWVKRYKINSFTYVGFKLASEDDQVEINARAQIARSRGDKRKLKKIVEGVDQNNNPFKEEREEEGWFNLDTLRSDRFAELVAYVKYINTSNLPDDYYEKSNILRTYSASFLDLMFAKLIEFKALVASTLRDIETF